MITCWGETFTSVDELWHSPRCYISTTSVLRHRLESMPPEEAVNPRRFEYGGKIYKSIYKLHRECGDFLSLTELYKRLGLIFYGVRKGKAGWRKLTPYQVVHQWHLFRQMPRTGIFGTTLQPVQLVKKRV